MNIIGKEIILRAIEPQDNEVLRSMINDPEMEYMLGGWSFPVSSVAQAKWHETLESDASIIRCAIQLKNEAAIIGSVMLTDIDYKNGCAGIHIKICANNHRGKGYGTETICLVTKFAFCELRLNCIYAHVNEHNNISQRLFEKCGFNKEGILKNRLYKRGEYVDVVSYSLLRSNSL